MELIRNLKSIIRRDKGCVATIGNFDGIHLGHQTIISQLKEIADQRDLLTAVIIFEPQPQEYFSPESAPARLTRLREKIEQLDCFDIDRLVCLRFDKKLAELIPTQFVKQILIDKLNIRHLIVGDDFRFGKNREGGFGTLKDMAKEFGYRLDHTNTCLFEGTRISSTRIRQALANDDLELARKLLGKNYCLSGRVVHGDKRGKGLGFPTANMELHRLHSPIGGIYVTRVHILYGQERDKNGEDNFHPAVTSIGTRPMFNGKGMRLETHILDFNESLYGKYIHVNFLKKLRSEMKYQNIDELKKAIEKDIENTRHYLSEIVSARIE